ncbi:MAG: hypothetical protein EPO35_13080 [Acidobacteria bacterium]|nr:MAG: hypothetical protein EPO35_13080 [Acidobacteriota bacterium]
MSLLMLGAFAAQTAVMPQSPGDLGISVMLRVDAASGRSSASAGSDQGNDVLARLSADADFCSVGSGNYALTRMHDLSWEISARITNRAADRVTVDVSWKQLEGPGSGLAARTQTVTLRSGERAVLETLRPASERCAKEARLEIEAGPRLRFATGRGAGASTGAGVSAGGAGAATGVSAGGFASAQALPGDRNMRTGALFTVEVWLMHKLADGSERIEGHDRAERVAVFSKTFDAVTIATSRGNVDVIVAMELRTLARETNPLLVLLDRRLSGAMSQRGSATRVGDFPRDGEVISMELPGFYDAPVSDVFSIRMKIEKLK